MPGSSGLMWHICYIPLVFNWKMTKRFLLICLSILVNDLFCCKYNYCSVLSTLVLQCIHPLRNTASWNKWVNVVTDWTHLRPLFVHGTKASTAFIAFPWSSGCAWSLHRKETQEFKWEKRPSAIFSSHQVQSRPQLQLSNWACPSPKACLTWGGETVII